MTRRQHIDNERGAAVVLFMILMTTMLLFVGLIVDGGNARQTRRQAQNAADAAALAGANVLYHVGVANFTNAVATVKTYAYSNYGVATTSWAGCGDASALAFRPDSGNNTCISFDSQTTPTLVRVTLPARQVPFLFGGLGGVASASVSAHAEAQITGSGVSSCAFCIVGTGSPYDGQNGTLSVNGDAGVAINGNASTKNNGGVDVASPYGTTLYSSGTASGNFSPSATTTAGALKDPLSGYPVPSFIGLTAHAGCSNGFAVPGIYASIPTCHLNGGLYVITGPTHISGQSLIDASAGVTLYLTCGSGTTPRACAAGGETGSDLVCSGNATFQITAPTIGPTANMAIFFDRNNTGGIDCRGNGASAVNGTIYGASAYLKMRGNGAGCDFNSLVILGAANFNGSPSTFCVDYDHTTNVPTANAPPMLVQ
jgi:Flp pilus assembly protein TadG